MKSCKSRESFCISILTIYTNDQLLDMFTGAMFIFSFVRFVNMCEPRTGWPTSIEILWKWASKSAKLAGDGECRLTRFQLIRNFVVNKIYLFQGCPIKQTVFLPGQPAPYNQLLIQPLLFQNAILYKLLKLWFWNFKPIFLRMQFPLIATFFSLVLAISLSWYFHLTISYLVLVTWHFGSQMVFPNI